jgi:hypothetical protein
MANARQHTHRPPREERALFNLARPNLMLLPLSYLIFLETGANRGATASQSTGKMPSWLQYVTAARLFNQRPLARARGDAINFGSQFQPLLLSPRHFHYWPNHAPDIIALVQFSVFSTINIISCWRCIYQSSRKYSHENFYVFQLCACFSSKVIWSSSK